MRGGMVQRVDERPCHTWTWIYDTLLDVERLLDVGRPRRDAAVLKCIKACAHLVHAAPGAAAIPQLPHQHARRKDIRRPAEVACAASTDTCLPTTCQPTHTPEHDMQQSGVQGRPLAARPGKRRFHFSGGHVSKQVSPSQNVTRQLHLRP
jgi:hypothetical protein